MGRTYDSLRQAEANIQKRSDRKTQLHDMEFYLSRVGLGEDQISTQNQNEVRQSLILLNRCIEKPDRLLKLCPSKGDVPLKNFDANVMPVLLDRKKHALLRYDSLINREKFEKIRFFAAKIADKNIRKTIESNLFQLVIKDQIFKKKYRKLDKIGNPYK